MIFALCTPVLLLLSTLLTRVYSDVASELITPRKSSVALRHRAGVRPLVHRGLARPVGVLPGPHWHQSDREVALLIHLAIRDMNQQLSPVKIQKWVYDVLSELYLTEDLVALARALVELGEGGGAHCAPPWVEVL